MRYGSRCSNTSTKAAAESPIQSSADGVVEAEDAHEQHRNGHVHGAEHGAHRQEELDGIVEIGAHPARPAAAFRQQAQRQPHQHGERRPDRPEVDRDGGEQGQQPG